VRLPADDEGVGEVAAVAVDDDRVIEDNHIALHEHALGGWATTALRAGRDGEVAVDNRGTSRRLDAGRIDAAVDVQFRHSRLDAGTGPGVAGLGRAHAAFELLDLVGVLATAQRGYRVDDRGGIRVAGAVVNADALVRGVDRGQQGELPRT